MSIELRKFRYSDEFKNYFAGGSYAPTFADKITLSHITIDGFPSYSEEYKNEFNEFNFVFGDFTIKFSLLQSETSDLGYSLKTFLTEDINDHCIAIKLTLPNKIISGFVDIGTIWVNETFSQNRYDVQFTCYPAEKEFRALGDKRPEVPASWFRDINGYLKHCHFWTIDLLTMRVDTSNLDWTSKVGFEPRLIRSDTLNNIWGWMLGQNQLYDSGQFDNVTTWSLFEDLCKFFGLIYKVAFGGDASGNKWYWNFYIGFRDTGFGSNTVTINTETYEYGFKRDPSFNRYIYFKFGQKTRVIGAIASRQFEWNSSDYGYGIIYDTLNNTYGVGYIVPVGSGTTDNVIDKRGDTRGNVYAVTTETANDLEFPIDQVTEITASKYFNPSTDEGSLYSHWRLGKNGHYLYFSEPRYNFSPMNFSFPMMFQSPLMNSPVLNNTNATVGGKGNWFRTANTSDDDVFSHTEAIMLNTANQYQFLLKENLKKKYRFRLSTLSETYNILDEASINSVDCSLIALQDYDIQNQKITGVFEEK